MSLSLPYPPTRLRVELPGPGGPLTVLRPARPEAIIDALTELDADEKLPYWAELWPSSLGLAWAIARGEVDVAGRSVTELGCGVGLVALAAARAGARRVLATDWYGECLAFARASAEENGLALETREVDWRAPPAEACADVVLAADVLYERRNARFVAGALRALIAPGGVGVVADPGRTYQKDLVAALSDWTCRREVFSVTSEHVPQGRAEITLLRFERS
jgi:predicted nicotinamide N-methyase